MELQALGFSDWFIKEFEALGETDRQAARVAAVDRENYLIRNASGEALAETSGKLRFTAESSLDLPAVGDWVLVQYYNDDTFAIIDEILPRKSILKRKTAGKKIDYQLIGANIDTALIMQSCDANFNLRRLERYLVMVTDGNIEPVILLSKSDLVPKDNLAEKMSAIKRSHIDCSIIAISCQTGQGLEEVRQTLEPTRTFCLLGSSGVGKTTLLNHLVGKDAFETNLVRKDGKGKHTTTRRQLTLLPGGAMIIDTPGMRELGNIGMNEGIHQSFADISELVHRCRFKDCTHTAETGCALLEAVEEGYLSRGRYQNYLKLMKESEYNEMSYEEKRHKDKKLGQFYKTGKETSRKFKQR